MKNNTEKMGLIQSGGCMQEHEIEDIHCNKDGTEDKNGPNKEMKQLDAEMEESLTKNEAYIQMKKVFYEMKCQFCSKINNSR